LSLLPVCVLCVKWVLCYHGTARPQVAVGRDGLQVWRVVANILNKESRTADRGWTSSLGVGHWANNPPPHRRSSNLLRN
jgi:N6-adenosine-specific RNA methylase IME4